VITFNANNIPATDAAAGHLLALLEIVAHPERAQQFLIDLKAALAENGKAAGLAEVEKYRAEIAAQQRVNDDRRNQLNSLEVSLGDAFRSLNEREAALAAKMDRLRALVPEAA
jgi:hypothetical protein